MIIKIHVCMYMCAKYEYVYIRDVPSSGSWVR